MVARKLAWHECTSKLSAKYRGNWRWFQLSKVKVC